MKNRSLPCYLMFFIFMVLIVTSCSHMNNAKNTNNNSREYFQIVDIYRIESAYEVQKNWIAPPSLKTNNSKNIAFIQFNIMPDGLIQDIAFVEKSGNAILDKAAIEAIKRASPLKPHPKKIFEKYIELGLRFGSGGVK